MLPSTAGRGVAVVVAAALTPTELLAVTDTAYVTALTSPVSVQVVAGGTEVHVRVVCPLAVAVTVYVVVAGSPLVTPCAQVAVAVVSPGATVRFVGAPGTLATMTTPDAEPGYRRIAGSDWKNEICASFALGLAFYRPVATAHRVRCPALLIVVDDSVAPAKAAVRTAQRIGASCQLHHLAMGHFDLYAGEGFDQGVRLQLAFLQRKVPVSGPLQAPLSTEANVSAGEATTRA